MRRLLALILLLALIPLSACTSTPHKRDSAYWPAAALEVADGYSTYRALHSGTNVHEVGKVAVAMFGDRPSDLEVLAFTMSKLAILESTRYFKHPSLQKAYSWGICILRPGVVMANWRIAIGNK